MRISAFNIVLTVLLTVSAVIPARALAQEQKPEKARPKIVLVLGGGGARGAAHTGVLKMLEECRVPVDLVIGTSMGAIVGGLYSAGMSPEQIEAKFKEIDWIDIFRDRPGEQYLSFRRKKDMTRLASIEFGFRDGKILIPRGLIQGQKLDFELEALGIPVSDIQDFDDLPVPFRAVSTDLGNGKAVVISSGSLSQAMRASMSIPGVFPPMQVEGRVLVDGMIAANVPVEVAKELGTDVIIAVDVGMPANPDPRDVTSTIDVTMQMFSLLTDQNVKQSLSLLTKDDILIVPELGDLSIASFDRVVEAIGIGEKAARSMKDKLSRYSVPEAEYRDYLARRSSIRNSGQEEATVLDFVRVEGLARIQSEAVTGRMRTREGHSLDLNILKEDLTRVYAMGDFETVNFEVVEEEGKKGLVVKAAEKPWGPNYLKFGLNLSSDSKTDSAFTGLVEYRMTRLNRLGAEWRNLLQFGEVRGIFSDWYQPLDAQDYFFTQVHVRTERDLRSFYVGNTLLSSYEEDFFGGGWDIGVNYRSYARAMAGIRKGVTDYSLVRNNIAIEYNGIEEGALLLQLEYDQLDNHLFPHKGSRHLLKYYSSKESLGAVQEYDKAELVLSSARTLYDNHTLIGLLDLGVTIDENAPVYDHFSTGGFMRLSGYGEDQLRGQDMATGGIYYYLRAGKLGMFYFGGGLECGNVWDDRIEASFDDLLWGGVVFAGMDTVLGPLYFGYGFTEESEDGRFHFYLGKTF